MRGLLSFVLQRNFWLQVRLELNTLLEKFVLSSMWHFLGPCRTCVVCPMIAFDIVYFAFFGKAY